MRKYAYHREVLNLTKQFVAAFDDTVVYRYTKDGEAKEKINVRYINGPKNRVLHDIVDKAKNITLPAISIEQKNIKRDSSRVQNKDYDILRKNLNSSGLTKIPQPVPISFDLDVSIIGFYKEDIDQIASNILVWFNPYIIISWKVPNDFGLDFVEEIRSEVYWSGDVSYENPINIGAEDKYRIVGSTSFTVKAWIFPPAPESPVAPIYVVKGDYHAVSTDYDFDNYNIVEDLSANPSSEIVAISAYPEITNVFYGRSPIFEDVRIPGYVDTTFNFFGKRFDIATTSWYLSSSQTIPGLEFQQLSTVKYPIISAYRVPDDKVTIVSDNVASLSLEANTLSGFDQFTFVVANSAGWGSWDHSFFLDYDPQNVFIQPDLRYSFLDPTGEYLFIAYE